MRTAPPASQTAVRADFISYIHNFRGFAIMMIVATHTLSMFDWSASPVLSNVLKRVFANSTVFFLFISGFLFQHLAHRYRPAPFYWKKIRNVLAPYVIASMPAIVIYTMFAHRTEAPPGIYDLPVWRQVLEFLLTGSHVNAFWYIPALALIFLVSPLLYAWDRHPRLYALLPLLLAVPFFVSRGFYKPQQAFVHYLPLFLVGMACSRYREPIHATSRHWLLPMALFAALMFATELRFAPGTHSWFSYMGKGALALVCLELFRRAGDAVDPWFSLAGTLSFGIYFVHSYMISAAKGVLSSVYGATPPGGVFIFLLAATWAIAASLVLVRLLVRLLGRHSQIVLGVAPSSPARPALTVFPPLTAESVSGTPADRRA